jgi:hypothetical protein
MASVLDTDRTALINAFAKIAEFAIFYDLEIQLNRNKLIMNL